MTVFLWLLLAFSLLSNVVLFRMLWRRAPAIEHAHTWTPWTDFRKMEERLYSVNGSVVFRRVRYCTACGKEQKQEAGEHNCELVTRGQHCPHMKDYTAIFDPLYELTQMDKELKRLEGL